jgi:hypothetical protein
MNNSMVSIKIFDHLVADLYWTPESSIFEEIYKDTRANVSDEQLKEYRIRKINIMSTIVDHASTLNGMLLDTSLFFHEITPEYQKWIDQHIVSFFNQRGLKKMCVIFSQGLFEQIALEEASTLCTNKYEVQFFADTHTAKRWLLDSSA